MSDFKGTATNSFFMWTQKTTKPSEVWFFAKIMYFNFEYSLEKKLSVFHENGFEQLQSTLL
jgi:hypothetical protein